MKPKKLHCLYCGKEFIATDRRQKFCCPLCGVRYHNKKKSPDKHPLKCIICGKEFIPWNKNQVTCGDKKCVDENIKNNKRAKRNYKYDKKAGIEASKKRKPNALSSPASKRWANMSWDDLTKELAYYGLRYRDAQLMAEKNTLPEDFGRRKKNANNKRSPSTDTDL